MSPPRILISAGEASGDRLGAGLARAMRTLAPDVELLGMGGEEMADAGVRLVQDASTVAVVGFVEVLAHLADIRAAMAKLEAAIERERPDVVVPIDFPDFNLRLAARAKRTGTRVVYFVSPQVWAWRRGRVRGIRRVVDRMLVLFPFETAFYEAFDVPVTFVGHPVVERVEPGVARRDLLARAGLDPARRTVALLPGSRRGEVRRLLGPLLEAARRLERDRPELQFLVSRASTVPRDALEPVVAAAGLGRAAVHAGDFPQILTACAAGAVASGTASLEAAVAGLPVVILYRMSPLSYAIARRLVRIEHVGLPNLVAGRRVVPELLQGECTGERIAAEVGAFLDEPARAAAARADLAEVRGRLGRPGALERAAEAVLGQVENALNPSVS